MLSHIIPLVPDLKLNFMEMNFKTMRHEPKPGDARPVVYQMSTSSPMEPRTL